MGVRGHLPPFFQKDKEFHLYLNELLSQIVWKHYTKAGNKAVLTADSALVRRLVIATVLGAWYQFEKFSLGFVAN